MTDNKHHPSAGDWLYEEVDYVSRLALVELYEAQGWPFTIGVEEADRSSIQWRFARALGLRIGRALGPDWRDLREVLRWDTDEIGKALGAGGGNLFRLDMPACDRNRVLEHIADIPDATVKRFYKVGKHHSANALRPVGADDSYHYENQKPRADFLKSIAAVAAQRVTFEALSNLYYFAIDVGGVQRLITKQAGLETLSVTECAIAEDGVTIKGGESRSGTDAYVKVANGIDGKTVTLTRDPEGRKPENVKLTTSLELKTGQSATLDGNSLTADYAVAIEDTPEAGP
ncbi:MAG: hypothetical protein OXI79_20385 [Gammaproteobacteria bacterium]|nr:hypothetical protein [Gammaproteobacteria bacterium]